MTAEIMMGERFLSIGEPGWHRLGTNFPAGTPMTLVEAAHASGVAYETKLVPTFALVDGQYILVEDRMAIVREPLGMETNWKPFDVVSKNYKLVDNLQFCQAFNPVSEIYPVETIGALGDGERMFAALDAGMMNILGDEVHQFFTLFDEKSGRSATKIFYTPVRVVCSNTLRMGIAAATLTVNVAHVAGNMNKLYKIAQLVIDMNLRMQSINDLFNHMAVTSYTMEDMKQALTHIYPDPKVPDAMQALLAPQLEQQQQAINQHRDLAMDLFGKWNDEQPKLALTQWGAYNSVVELEDWKKGRGDGQLVSALFGQRAETKQLAFAEITGVTK